MGICGSSLKKGTNTRTVVIRPAGTRIAQGDIANNPVFITPLPLAHNETSQCTPVFNPEVELLLSLSDALNELAEPIFIVDRTGKNIRYMNKAAKEKIGDRYLGMNFDSLFSDQYKASYNNPASSNYTLSFFHNNQSQMTSSASASTSVTTPVLKRKVPLVLQPNLDKPAVELLVDMRISTLSNGFAVHIIEPLEFVALLEHNLKQQKDIAHEGRNVRQAALKHIDGSREATESSIHGLKQLLPQATAAGFHSDVENLIKKMGRARYLQDLAVACERYISVVENYILSPDDEETFELQGWISSMIEMLSGSHRGINLKKAGLLTTTTEYFVRGHKAVLLYALVNLLQNAIKFTAPKLSTALAQQLDITISLMNEEGVFWIYVADQGIGMDPEQAKNCLGGHHKRYSRLIEGSGSGLSNIKIALNKVRGTLLVSSCLGEGTQFKFTLPLQLMKQENKAVDFAALRILVVDDSIINQKIMRKNLAALGINPLNILCVASKQEGLALFKQQHDSVLGLGFHVVFTDLVMPQGSGLELAQEIRAFEASVSQKNPVNIVVVSGTSAPQNDPLLVFISSWITKPFAKADIKALLLNLPQPNLHYVYRDGTKEIDEGLSLSFRP